MVGNTVPAGEPPSEQNAAMPGLLCEGLNLFAGTPRLGKSWLSLELGAATGGERR